jgi:hypothetical protein
MRLEQVGVFKYFLSFDCYNPSLFLLFKTWALTEIDLYLLQILSLLSRAFGHVNIIVMF